MTDERDDLQNQLEMPPASLVSEPVDHSPQALRTWLLETARYLGLTSTELAKEAGLAASTVNRFLREEDSSGLTARTIDAVIKTAKAIESEVSSEGQRRIPLGKLEDRPYLTIIPVLGKAGVSLQPIKSFVTKLYSVKVPVPPQFIYYAAGAYEVEDDHAAPHYPKGSVVVVAPDRRNNEPQRILFEDQDHLAILDQTSGIRNEDGNPLQTMTIRKLALSPSNEWWLLRLNRDFDGLPDCLLHSRRHMRLLVLGSYQPRPDVSKKALAPGPD
jgi:hypothetical protein